MNYQALAPFYDRLMSHVRYDEWAAFVRKIVQSRAPRPDPSILEVGGGTGVLAERLRKAGIRVVGCDLSVAMCRQAGRRGLRFFAADARHLPVKTAFDMVVFLYDGINYLLALDDYVALFREICGRLSAGGLFLFDITTKHNSEKNFREFVDFDDFGQHFFLRHSYYDAYEQLQHNDFVIFTRSLDGSGLYDKGREEHVQRVFSPEAIRDVVPRDLFEVAGIWDDFTFRKFTSRSDRIHFLLKKKAAV